MPDLVEVGSEFTKNGGRLLLVSYDLQVPGAVRDEATLAKVSAFLEKCGFRGECLVLEPSAITEFEQHFALPGGVPQTLAVAADGSVVGRLEDAGHKADFQALVDKLRR